MAAHVHVNLAKLASFWIRLIISVLVFMSTVLIGVGPGVCKTVKTLQCSITNCTNINWNIGAWGNINYELQIHDVGTKFDVQYMVFVASLLLHLYMVFLCYIAWFWNIDGDCHGLSILVLFLSLATLGGFEVWIGHLYNDDMGSTVVRGWLVAGALYLVSMLLALTDLALMSFKPLTKCDHY